MPAQLKSGEQFQVKVIIFSTHVDISVSAICLEVLVDRDDVRRLQCQHVFHSSCIDSWFQNRHVDCPLCKSVFILNRQDDLRLECVR